jgi:hypothetical protein
MAYKNGDKGNVNNPDWREASVIPDSLVSTDEIVDKTTQIHYVSPADLNPEWMEHVFRNGLTIEAGRVTAIVVTETIKTTFRMSRKA